MQSTRFKNIIWLLFLFVIACTLGCPSSNAVAQDTTTVSATIVDSDTTTWVNGTWSAVLNNPYPNIQPTFIDTGSPVTGNYAGLLNTGGTFTQVMPNNLAINPAGTTWTFQFCPWASFKCSYLLPQVITGTSFSLSAIATAQITAPRFNSGPLAYGYANVEIITPPVIGSSYWNVIAAAQFQWNGSAWVSGGGGGSFTAGGDLSGSSTSQVVIGINGSPINGSQTQNEFLGTPDGAAGAVGLRALVSGDIPNNAANTSGSAHSLDHTPTPCSVNGQFATGISSTGAAICSTPGGSSSTHNVNADNYGVGTWGGTWSSSTTYAIGTAVSFNGVSFLAVFPSTNQMPETGCVYDTNTGTIPLNPWVTGGQTSCSPNSAYWEPQFYTPPTSSFIPQPLDTALAIANAFTDVNGNVPAAPAVVLSGTTYTKNGSGEMSNSANNTTPAIRGEGVFNTTINQMNDSAYPFTASVTPGNTFTTSSKFPFRIGDLVQPGLAGTSFTAVIDGVSNNLTSINGGAGTSQTFTTGEWIACNGVQPHSQVVSTTAGGAGTISIGLSFPTLFATTGTPVNCYPLFGGMVYPNYSLNTTPGNHVDTTYVTAVTQSTTTGLQTVTLASNLGTVFNQTNSAATLLVGMPVIRHTVTPVSQAGGTVYCSYGGFLVQSLGHTFGDYDFSSCQRPDFYSIQARDIPYIVGTQSNNINSGVPIGNYPTEWFGNLNFGANAYMPDVHFSALTANNIPVTGSAVAGSGYITPIITGGAVTGAYIGTTYVCNLANTTAGTPCTMTNTEGITASSGSAANGYVIAGPQYGGTFSANTTLSSVSTNTSITFSTQPSVAGNVYFTLFSGLAGNYALPNVTIWVYGSSLNSQYPCTTMPVGLYANMIVDSVNGGYKLNPANPITVGTSSQNATYNNGGAGCTPTTPQGLQTYITGQTIINNGTYLQANLTVPTSVIVAFTSVSDSDGSAGPIIAQGGANKAAFYVGNHSGDSWSHRHAFNGAGTQIRVALWDDKGGQQDTFLNSDSIGQYGIVLNAAANTDHVNNFQKFWNHNAGYYAGYSDVFLATGASVDFEYAGCGDYQVDGGYNLVMTAGGAVDPVIFPTYSGRSVQNCDGELLANDYSAGVVNVGSAALSVYNNKNVQSYPLQLVGNTYLTGTGAIPCPLGLYNFLGTDLNELRLSWTQNCLQTQDANYFPPGVNFITPFTATYSGSTATNYAAPYLNLRGSAITTGNVPIAVNTLFQQYLGTGVNPPAAGAIYTTNTTGPNYIGIPGLIDVADAQTLNSTIPNVSNGGNATYLQTSPTTSSSLDQQRPLNAAVKTVTVTAGGTGYANSGTVTDSSGLCTIPPAGTWTASGGIISAFSVTYNAGTGANPGAYCTGPPVFTPTGGTGAVLTPNMGTTTTISCHADGLAGCQSYRTNYSVKTAAAVTYGSNLYYDDFSGDAMRFSYSWATRTGANWTGAVTLTTIVPLQYYTVSGAVTSLTFPTPTLGDTCIKLVLTMNGTGGWAVAAPSGVLNWFPHSNGIVGKTANGVNSQTFCYSLGLTTWIGQGDDITNGGSATNTITVTPGTGVTSVTCATATCSYLRGTYTVVGGTFTTGTYAALAWGNSGYIPICEVSQNGGTAWLGIGHSVATATGMNATNAVTIAGVTFTFDYQCFAPNI